MATVKEVIDGVFDELRELKDDEPTFRAMVIEKSYLYTEEFRIPGISSWGVFIRPSVLWKGRVPKLGNRMDEYYTVELFIILKLDAKDTGHYFARGIELIEQKLTHNTLDEAVQVVGNNVSWELIDMGEQRTMTALMRYQCREIISITTL